MKILVTALDLPHLGGVLHYVETLTLGLKQNGHDVDFAVITSKFKKDKPHKYTPNKKRVSLRLGEGTGLYSDLQVPWHGAKLIRTHIPDDIKQLEEYDLVIHSMLHIPTKRDEGLNVFDVFTNHEAKQIGIAHDPSCKKSMSYLSHFPEKFDCLICVHEGTFNASKGLGIPARFIPNPHVVTDLSMRGPDIRERAPSVFSGHSWRAPYKKLKYVIQTMIAMAEAGYKGDISGEGIEMHYLKSPTKCPEDFKDEFGTPFYDLAQQEYITFLGYIHTEEQYEYMKNSTFFLDFDYRSHTNSFGSLFNRTLIECFISGCIPVLCRETIQGSRLFDEGINYLAVSRHNLVASVDYMLDMYLSPEKMRDMQVTNWLAVHQFDHNFIAEEIVETAFGGRYTEHDSVDVEIYEAGRKKLEQA